MSEKNKNYTGWAIALGVLCVATLVLEIFSSNDKKSDLETALFGILQFLFSVFFAWVISKSASEEEFKNRQKNFAISAFRRIREISRAANRLLQRTGRDQSEMSDDLKHELEVIREISKGICDTAESSVADWADLIGQELATLEKIENLPLSEDPTSDKDTEISEESSATEVQHLIPTESLSDLYAKLIRDLPPSLRVEATQSRRELPNRQRIKRVLEGALKRDGFAELQGFWSKEAELDIPIRELVVGEEANVAIGDAGSRISALILYNKNGKSAGVIINPYSKEFGASYPEFVFALTSVARKSKFEVVVSEIGDTKISSGRVYFKVKLQAKSSSESN